MDEPLSKLTLVDLLLELFDHRGIEGGDAVEGSGHIGLSDVGSPCECT